MSGIAAEMELEHELEFEGELEGEGELEHELEFESQHESEHEQEHEHEAFFNHLSAMADRGGRSQALRRIALAAARSALRANPRTYPVIEGELEFEGEFEGEGELPLHATPAEREHFASMMEHMGHSAAEAANEQEAAEHFLPLVGLAAKFVAPKLLSFAAKKIGGKLLGKVGSQVARRIAPRILGKIAPRLTRGIGNITRTLYRNRSTRPLLHAVPRIARNTMRTLVRQAARGKRISPQFASRQLARQTVRTLSNPRILNRTYRTSLVWDRRFHRNSRRLLGRPIGRFVRASGGPGYLPGGVVGGTTFGGTTFTTGSPLAVPTSGGCNCRCSCQPAGTATAVCPTCGR